jgi:hypothetical protein
MSLTLPSRLDEDTLPVILNQAGVVFMGDGLLSLISASSFRPEDLLSVATVNSALIAWGYSAGDATLVTNELTRRNATIP